MRTSMARHVGLASIIVLAVVLSSAVVRGAEWAPPRQPAGTSPPPVAVVAAAASPTQPPSPIPFISPATSIASPPIDDALLAPATPTQTAPELPPGALTTSDIPLNATLPTSASVAGFSGRPQTLSLSCEARSAADWAGYFGLKIDELTFLRALPVSDDPDRGFVGDVRGTWGQLPPNAYGVHAGPVARLLQQNGVLAYYHLQMTWEGLQTEIAAGRPVIVWVTGHVEPGIGRLYTASDGHRTVVARFEHTVIVVGYSPDGVTIEDGGPHYTRSLDTFLQSWRALRNMAITARP